MQAETIHAPEPASEPPGPIAPSVDAQANDALAEQAIAARSRLGTTLSGKWHLDSVLGVGGMAAVYAATHRNGIRGAVKVMHQRLVGSTKVRRRFQREGILANLVQHPGAVRVLDEDETEDGHLYLVMDLLRGQTLEALAEENGGKLEPQLAIRFVDRVLATLAVAHAAGVVHRDVKPDNIFVTDDGEVKVLDFGIARAAEDAASPSLTQTGEAMGTPAFMAPEQARGRWAEVDERSDVYAVGATLFTLLSGELVHPEGTIAEMMAATFLAQARSLGSVAPHLPHALVAVVDRALRLEKSERWPDAESMRLALRAAAHETQPLQRSRRLVALSAIAIGGALLVTFGAIAFASPRQVSASRTIAMTSATPAAHEATGGALVAPASPATTNHAPSQVASPPPIVVVPPSVTTAALPSAAAKRPTIYDRRF